MGSPSNDRAHTRRRPLQIEPLEVRHLMDAAGLAAFVAPTWFQTISDLTGPEHAGVATWTAEGLTQPDQQSDTLQGDQSNLYDWIVQFDTASLAGIASVAETTSLLVGGGVDFAVVRGLGLAGQVLVRSSGASLDAVAGWLASDLHVASFEQDVVGQLQTTPNDPQLGNLWGMTKIHAQDAWSIATGSQSVVVGVIDTGVDYTHPDLAANIWTNPGEIAGNGVDDDHNGFVDDLHGYDFINNDGDPMDDNSHGTHVSGTIAAVGNNAQGVAGVNWSTSVMALKFLSGQGSGYLSDAVRAINYATMMRTSYGVNIRVTNNSWGGGGFSSSMQNAIQANNDAGILFVAAAGNSASNNDAAPQYPANYTPPNVISVAASDSNDQLASFSSYGATTVDLAAPGVSIYSTIPGNRYASYSGTSMATPHVAGVAALAWSLAPNASVAEIRNAILQGADPVAAFSGKMVTGGRLNAYNTLRLLGAQPPQGPVIASLTAAPNPVTAGSVITLGAHGISDATGAITGVYFFQDINDSGQYDPGDPVVASTATIVGGEASVSVSTSGFAPGAYRYFVSALDNNLRGSPMVATTLTVLAADDHGNNAAAATTVGIPSSTQGVLGLTNDVDWFKFETLAGKTYIFTTQLGTLRDSTLSLYDRNGTTRLAFNDDYGGSLASRIAWTAPASGTYYIAAASYGSYYTGSYVLGVQVQNSAPVLSPIGSQTMSHAQTSLSVALSASDADADALTYSVQALAVDPLAQKAYDLDQQLGLYRYNNSDYTNYRGASEKYLIGNNNSWYFILPSGELYRWGGSINDSTLVETFNQSYYANPSLLYNAQPPSYTPVSGSDVSLSLSGNVLSITRAASYVSDFYVRVTVSDGTTTDAETFKVSVANAAPVLSPIGNQTMSHTQTSLTIPLSVSDADADTLAYSLQALAVDPLAQRAYDLDQQLGLNQYNNSDYTNYRGAGEKYLIGNNNTWYFIVPSGALYSWGGSINDSTLVETFSQAYYADPSLLHNAQRPTYTPISDGDVHLSLSGNVLSITRAASYVSDFYVRVTVSDGRVADTETFKVSVTNSAPVLAAIDNQAMAHTQTSLSVPLSVSDADGDALTYSVQALAVDPLAKKAYDLDQQLGLNQYNNCDYTNYRGASEKYLIGNNNSWYFIVPSGALYRWGSNINDGALVETFNQTYYANPSLLYNAQPPSYTPISDSDVHLSLSDNVLSITRAADFGDFYVRVTVSDGTTADAETFKVSVANSAPVLAAIDNQAMAHTQTSLSVPLSVSDADADAVTYSAQALAVDPLAQKAYDLDRQLGLYQWNNSYFTNYRGAGEKYLGSADGTFHFLLSDGGLYRWGGSINGSTLVETFNQAYYADPTLLHDAQPPTYTPISDSDVTLSISGDVLSITRAASYGNDFHVRVTASDGMAADTEMFKVSVTHSTASLHGASIKIASFAVPSYLSAASSDLVRAATPSFRSTPPLLAMASYRLSGSGAAHNVSDALAAASTPSEAMPLLHDDILSRLTAREGLSVDRDRLLTALDNQSEYPSAGHFADVRLPRVETALRGVARPDARAELPVSREQPPVEDLLAHCHAERHVIDEVFDLLGDL